MRGKNARPAVLVFDLDDTLLDSESAYRQALVASGLGRHRSQYLKARRAVKALLGPTHVSSHNRLLYFKKMFSSGTGSSAANLLRLMSTYERHVETAFKREWKKRGRKKLFEALAKQFHLAILSNETTRTQLLKLRAIDPHGRLFRTVLTSEEVGVEKPDPRMLRTLLAMVKARPGQCIMVGDSVENDIKPALRMGMQAVLTSEFKRPHAAIPPRATMITRLADLPLVLSR